MLVNHFGSRDVDRPEKDVELFIDDAKGTWLFRFSICFNDGPGRLDCFDDGCG